MNRKIGEILLTVYIVIIGIVIAVMSISYEKNGVNISFNNEQAVLFNKGWSLETSNGRVPVDVPGKIEMNPGQWFTIVNKMPNDSIEARTICLRGSMNSFIVRCGDDIIYDYIGMKGESPGNLEGSMWHFFRVPLEHNGEEISISIKSGAETFAGTINPIYMGTKASIIYKIIGEHGFGFILSLISLAVGIVLLVVYYVTKKKIDYLNLFYLSLTIITLSVWLMSETKILQLFMGNYFLVTKLTFIALALVPIPLTLFLENSFTKHHKSLTPILLVFMTFNVAAVIALHITGKRDFFLTFTTTTTLICIGILYQVISMIYEIVKYKNKEAKRTLEPFIIPFIFGVYEFIQLYSGNFMNTGKSIQYGILLYTVVLVVIAVRKLDEFSLKYHETLYFKKLAYTDILTGAKNRAAYNDDIKLYCEILDDGKESKLMRDNQFWLLLFDLNGLKSINDIKGHIAGDKAIKLSYECIKEIFGDDGNVYRLGGDEFAGILLNATSQGIEAKCKKFKALTDKISEREDIAVSISVGYGNYKRGKWSSYDTFYHFVDNEMYSNKRAMKGLE